MVSLPRLLISFLWAFWRHFLQCVVTQAAQLLQPVGGCPGRTACQVANFIAVGLLAAFCRISCQGRNLHCGGPPGGIASNPWVVIQVTLLLQSVGSYPGHGAPMALLWAFLRHSLASWPRSQISLLWAFWLRLLCGWSPRPHSCSNLWVATQAAGLPFHCCGPSGGIQWYPFPGCCWRHSIQFVGGHPGCIAASTRG